MGHMRPQQVGPQQVGQVSRRTGVGPVRSAVVSGRPRGAPTRPGRCFVSSTVDRNADAKGLSTNGLGS